MDEAKKKTKPKAKTTGSAPAPKVTKRKAATGKKTKSKKVKKVKTTAVIETKKVDVKETRAKEKLFITYPSQVFERGIGIVHGRPSRFIDMLPDDVLEKHRIEVW